MEVRGDSASQYENQKISLPCFRQQVETGYYSNHVTKVVFKLHRCACQIATQKLSWTMKSSIFWHIKSV
jgi:hypothetical protein